MYRVVVIAEKGKSTAARAIEVLLLGDCSRGDIPQTHELEKIRVEILGGDKDVFFVDAILFKNMEYGEARRYMLKCRRAFKKLPEWATK